MYVIVGMSVRQQSRGSLTATDNKRGSQHITWVSHPRRDSIKHRFSSAFHSTQVMACRALVRAVVLTEPTENEPCASMTTFDRLGSACQLKVIFIC